MKDEQKVVVTSSKSFFDYLKELGLVNQNVRVVNQATRDNIGGMHAFGTMPLYLAARAASVTVVLLERRPWMNPNKMTLAEWREAATYVETYVVGTTCSIHVSNFAHDKHRRENAPESKEGR